MKFSEFLDKVANKLAVLGVFNALFIYSLTLERSLPAKALGVCLLVLTFLVFWTIIREAAASTRSGDFSFAILIVALVAGLLALLGYALAKYPEFLHTIIFSFGFLLGALIYFFSSEFFSGRKLTKHWIIFRTDTTFHDGLCVVTGIVAGYFLDGVCFIQLSVWANRVL